MYYLQSRYYDPAIGRFINADGLDYLGANGDLNSYNLYAYCSNNPVMYTDPSGKSVIGTILLVVGIAFSVAATANDIYQLRDKNREDAEEIKVEVKEGNVSIQNSYKIITPWMRLGYSIYLNHFHENAKSVIQGSTLGVVYEWELHNLAAWITGSESARDLDVGKTIFADGESHKIEDDIVNGIMSFFMRATYMLAPDPISITGDLIINGGF